MSNPAELARQIEQLNDDQWYDFLDRLDDVSRRRQELHPIESSPPHNDRETVAAWVARRHLTTDPSIREVWHLPVVAPPAEIRLLEVSGRLTGASETIAPITFALDVEAATFELAVADITSDDLELIKADRQQLPSGWTLDGASVWRRRV